MLLVNSIILVCCVAIFIEDILSRSVHWFLFPMLFFALLTAQYELDNNWMILFQQTVYNFLFLVVQLAILTIYFSIKQKQITNITNGLLGWGDILLLISITTYFSLFTFILFYIGSLILVLLIWLIIERVNNNKPSHIPLAGLQALLFMMLFAAGWIQPGLRFNNKEWMISSLLP